MRLEAPLPTSMYSPEVWWVGVAASSSPPQAPASTPLSRSASSPHSLSVCAVQPILAAVDETAAQREVCSPSWSRTSRTRGFGSRQKSVRRPACYGSTLSTIEAFGKPGAVHSHAGRGLITAPRPGSCRRQSKSPLTQRRGLKREGCRHEARRLQLSRFRTLHPCPRVARLGLDIPGARECKVP